MADWIRWCSEEGEAPEGVRELLRAASAPAPMPAASHARALSYATELASGKAVGALSVVGGKVLASGLVVGTTCAVVALAIGPRDPTATVLTPAVGNDAREPVTQVLPRQELTDAPTMSDGIREKSRPVADAPALQPPANAGDAPEPQPTHARRATPARTARPQPQAATSRTADTAQTLAEEAALLERARRALAADPALALSLTLAHTKRFPHGQLLPASQVVAIEALRRLGREDEAQARARRFVGAQPDSLYSDRVRQLIPTE